MQAEGFWQQGKKLQTLSAVPIIMSFCLGLRFSLLRSASSCSMPPLTMIFCLSGGTPVRLYSWFLNTSPGIVVSTSTSWLSLPHFTLTCTIVLVSAWGNSVNLQMFGISHRATAISAGCCNPSRPIAYI